MSVPEIAQGSDTLPVRSRIRVALAGNPNSGKTSLFNVLTGHRYKVANYPGVTVEKKEGKLLLDTFDICLVDLPGMYSFSGDSLDEQVAIAALSATGEKTDEKLDIVVCLVDATNLERNLFVALELIDREIPCIIALSMIDLAQRQGISVRTELLSQALDVPVLTVSSHTREGVSQLLAELDTQLRIGPRVSERRYAWKKAAPTDENFAAEAGARYRWIHEVLSRTVSYRDPGKRAVSDRVDEVLLHPLWGLLFFVIVMASLFQAIFSFAAIPMDLIDAGVSASADFLSGLMPEGLLKSLLIDGILAGVGSVIIFIPQIFVLCFLISLLEDTGYLCRAAAIMDRVMRKVGLQGRSFVPLLSSFACAIPGIMATRTIPKFRDRIATILVAPLMSCSARIPVYALLIAAFIPQSRVLGVLSLQGLVLLGLYVLGVVAAGVVAFILKLTLLRGEPSHFVMEMPPYRMPQLGNALHTSWDKVYLFLKDAGTVILACSILIWFLTTHPKSENPSAEQRVQESYAGQIGRSIEPVIAPLGYDWKIGVGIIASFAAREVFVSSMATIFSVGDEEDSHSLIAMMKKAKRADGTLAYDIPVALSLMVFFVFALSVHVDVGNLSKRNRIVELVGAHVWLHDSSRLWLGLCHLSSHAVDARLGTLR